jgi:TnpA family transposase
MSAVSEVQKKFNELENAMRIHLGKVDPTLIIDLILHQKKEKDPIYTLEVFIKAG